MIGCLDIRIIVFLLEYGSNKAYFSELGLRAINKADKIYPGADAGIKALLKGDPGESVHINLMRTNFSPW